MREFDIDLEWKILRETIQSIESFYEQINSKRMEMAKKWWEERCWEHFKISVEWWLRWNGCERGNKCDHPILRVDLCCARTPLKIPLGEDGLIPIPHSLHHIGFIPMHRPFSFELNSSPFPPFISFPWKSLPPFLWPIWPRNSPATSQIGIGFYFFFIGLLKKWKKQGTKEGKADDE